MGFEETDVNVTQNYITSKNWKNYPLLNVMCGEHLHHFYISYRFYLQYEHLFNAPHLYGQKLFITALI